MHLKNKLIKYLRMTSMNVKEKDRCDKPDVVVVESTCRCLRNTRRTPDGRGLCSINPLRYNLWSQFKLLAKPNSPHRLFGRPGKQTEGRR